MPEAIPFTAKDGRAGVVRPAVARDAKAAIAIVREAVAGLPRTLNTTVEELWSPREWRRHRMDWGRQGATLVAELDGRVVGSLDVARGRRRAHSHTAQLGISVASEVRGVGVGHALMLAVEEWAGEVGVERLELGVFATNERARTLYERMGYEVEGTQRDAARFPEGDYDLVLMAKWLR